MNRLTAHLIDDAGFISPRAVADEFHTTVKEVAVLTGLSPDTVAKQSRFRSKASQQRLRDIVMILNRALPWCGTPMQAYAWFRSEPIPSFGDLTAEELVKRGMAEAVKEYIGRIAEGGYA
ncbi:MAG: MbcA/ParS/Xre antitoxin family protein [Candidatus Thiodiazotropha sp. (ex Epidulcina cf. delphinae)]|nr:MbcA/ParS/Xre antitoxin family protein [Candidatus Thiodiazotropha sp. (ex Epidulcina cf. delphinae)]